MSRRKPPTKKKQTEAKPRVPRWRDGQDIYSVPGMAAKTGDTERGIYAKCERGLLPHRRLNGRIIFLAAEIDEFLRGLPGVTLAEAKANLAARGDAGGT